MDEGSVVNNRPHASHVPKDKKNSNNKLRNITIAAAGVLIAIVAFVSWSFYQSSVTAHIDSSKYQAVFLTNGQIFYGKLHRLNGDYFRLTDVWYLQLKSSTSDQAVAQDTLTKKSVTDVTLIKMGSELHGPEDEVVMSRDQILYFENLNLKGTVTKTILSEKK